MNLDQYKTTNETAFYKNIPIAHLEEVKAYFKGQGQKIRVRYRGQRNNPADTRPSYQRWNWCLPQFADRFSVYLEGRTNRTYTKPYETPKQPRTLYEFHKAVITTAYCYADSLEEAQRMMGNGAMFVSMRKVGE
jgi:hypothetical protein